MAILRTFYEQQILEEIHDIPISEFPRLIRLLHLIKEEFFHPEIYQKKERPQHDNQTLHKQEDINRAMTAVENTWASIPLDKEIAKYVAEDKELEYDM